MGSLIRTVFGGGSSDSQSQQHSWNKAYPMLSSALGSSVDYVPQSGSAISSLLSGDTSGFNNYKKATGYDFANNQGVNGIMTNMRAQGLGNSGAALKALANFGEGLQSQYANNYLSNLFNLGSLGTSAAQVLSGAGQESTGSSTSHSVNYTGNFGKAIGFGLNAMAGG